MWAGLFMLLLLSIVMAAASFLAGLLPLSFTLSPRKLRLMTALGTGVLVGTALIVIIPEGVETLYKANEGAHTFDARSMPVSGSAVPGLYRRSDAGSSKIWLREAWPLPANSDDFFRTGPDDGFSTPNIDDDTPFPEPGGTPDYEDAPAVGFPAAGVSAADRDPHVWIGAALITGFILMYLIDTVPQQASISLQQQPQRFHISLNQFSFNRLRSSSNPLPEEDLMDDSEHVQSSSRASEKDSRPSSTTLGLVIHAAADGVALGASSTSGSSSGKRNLNLIIFVALMLHKAPAAFGLTSVLLKQGLSKRMARTHLVVFSLAAPAGALLTYLAVHILGQAGNADSPEGEFATGVLLLFSGGTFLYVAVHTMQEGSKISGRHSHGDENGYVNVENPYAPSSSAGTKNQVSGQGLADVVVTVCGMLLPLITQWGHTGH